MRTRHPMRHQRGFNLIELMIAMTIGLVLVAGMGGLISSQTAARKELEKQGRQIESGRYAATLIANDLRHAGYYGIHYLTDAAPTTLPNPCSVAVSDVNAALALPVQTYSNLASIPIVAGTLSDCLQNSNHKAGTDVLVVRRADTTNVSLASLTVGQIYLQTMPTQRAVGVATGVASTDAGTFNLTKKNGGAADIAKLQTNIYFVSPCNEIASASVACDGAADGGHPIPTLKRLELTQTGGSATYTTVPLVDGVEELHIDYGIDTDGDGVADTYVNAPTLAQMSNIVSATINILARNTEATGGYTNTKIFNLGTAGTFGPYNDQYKRHAYSMTVRVNNVSQRREQ